MTTDSKNVKTANHSSHLDLPYPSIKVGAVIALWVVLVGHFLEVIPLQSTSGKIPLGTLMFIFITWGLSLLLFYPFFNVEEKYRTLKENNRRDWLFLLLINSLAAVSIPFISFVFYNNIMYK